MAKDPNNEAPHDPVLAALKEIQASLTGISQRLTTVEADQAVLMANDEKLNGRINEVAAVSGGVSDGVASQQVVELQRKLEEVENNPLLTRDPQKIKQRHQQALKRAGEREREAGVHNMWHPELNPAKRDNLPLCRTAKTVADKLELEGLGYCDSLEQAAERLLANEQARHKQELELFAHARENGLPATAPVPPRFANVLAAKNALHLAEQRRAREQVASQPAPQAAQAQAVSAA